jgi:diacylglycerol O-acyltransferase 1
VTGLLLNLVVLGIAYWIESIIIAMLIVWNVIDSPTTGAVVLFHATITWMKLISYMLANEDYRLTSREEGASSATSSLSIVENLDSDEADKTYPQNVTLQNMLYFWVAPSLTYQIAFPRSPQIRWFKVASLATRLIITGAIFSFLIAQIVTPTLESLVRDLEETNGRYTIGILADYW